MTNITSLNGIQHDVLAVVLDDEYQSCETCQPDICDFGFVAPIHQYCRNRARYIW